MAEVRNQKAVIKPAVVLQNSEISKGIYSLWLEAPWIASDVKPGQFITLYSKDGSTILPRPISICEIDKENGRIRIVFRVVGKGTKEFSLYRKNDLVKVMGPLGNGFTLEGKKALLIGGGIGIPPMLELVKQLNCEKQVVLGYRDCTFMEKDFEAYANVYRSTEDGSQGVRGNVIDAIHYYHLEADIIFACGPTPMLRGVKAYAKEHGIKAQLSLEERMACGIGACLACVCQSKDVDKHNHVKNKRICKDGPVFYAEEIEM